MGAIPTLRRFNALHELRAGQQAFVSQLLSNRAHPLRRSVLIEPELGEAPPTRCDEEGSKERK